MTVQEAEAMLTRVVVPFHAGRSLHPKIVKQVLKAIQGTP